ncbi:MAG: nucleotidyltransferase domain-containing protein [Candidatus Brocadiales bacterium]|nr:nucleotidyltransferase domain-containing protein [Candidatus Brocadiales bacterium]
MKLDTPLEKAVKIIVQLSDPDKIILFGSRAREDYKDESDYDYWC